METNIVEIGKQLFKGAMQEISTYLVILFVAIVVIGLLRNAFSVGLDSTDKDKWNRSGLKVLIDNRTGVHYLSDGHGGMHIRVDATGKTITGK
jgi:hypothetical protein